MMVEPLHKPPSKHDRSGIIIYCNRCDKTVTDICKESGKLLKKCLYGEFHRFKATFYGKDGKRQNRILESRDYHEAVLEKRRIENEIKEDRLGINKKGIQERKQDNTPKLLIHCFARYISYLNNEGVPIHLQKERSIGHRKDVERNLKLVIECLVENGHDPDEFTIDDLNDNVIGELHKFLEKKNYSPRSFNKILSYGVTFSKWFSEEHYTIRNWFARGNRKEVISNPQGISQEWYEALLLKIDRERGKKVDMTASKGKRYLYREWLADGIKLGLETGRRREEIISMKWNDIVVDKNDTPLYIKVEDIKVNRIQHKQQNKKVIYVPVTESLQQLLVELNYNKKKNSDEYILAPEIINNRVKNISDGLSRGFTHYFDKLETGKKLTYKSLRKSYITNLKLHMGDPESITGHSRGSSVVENFYLDKAQIAIAMRDFKVFPEKNKDRTEELNEIRNNPTNNQKSIEK